MRNRDAPVHELLPLTPDYVLARLPAPVAGDIFLDLEGDPFARDGGRECLFGMVMIGAQGQENCHQLWARNDGEEKGAFEIRTVVQIVARY